jgi:hypothetical protein
VRLALQWCRRQLKEAYKEQRYLHTEARVSVVASSAAALGRNAIAFLLRAALVG